MAMVGSVAHHARLGARRTGKRRDGGWRAAYSAASAICSAATALFLPSSGPWWPNNQRNVIHSMERSMTATPRHYVPAAPSAPVIVWLAGADPHDRTSRIAARRNFVHVKRCFMAAVERVDGRRGDWLKHQVRQTNEAVDLWLLRGAVFDALSARGPEAQPLRIELQRALESVMQSGIDEDDDLLMAF
jgi:hypothetical protein